MEELDRWLRRLALWAQGGERRAAALLRLLRRRARPGATAVGRTAWAETVERALASLAASVGLAGWRRGAALLASVLGGALLLAAALGGRGGAPLQPGTAPAIIAFYQNGWGARFRNSLDSLLHHYRYIDTVLAFWYSLDGDGRLHAHAPQPGVSAWARSHHVRMGVLINNVAGASGDHAGMLRTAAVRARAARAVADLVARDHYQEVNIDFELLPADARDGLTRFMQTLRADLPRSVTLSQSVFPKVGVTSDVNGAYDYRALARAADYLVIMLYDKHSSGGPAGPVSPYPWVVANMNWFLHTARIPASRLVLGIGVYGYDWPVGGTDAAELPLTAVTAKARAEHARVRVDPASRNPYFRYTDASGQAHVVWFQDRRTVAQRLALARRLGLRGVAIWALGEETPAVWQVIEETTAPSH